jgi:copper chaperone NosL
MRRQASPTPRFPAGVGPPSGRELEGQGVKSEERGVTRLRSIGARRAAYHALLRTWRMRAVLTGILVGLLTAACSIQPQPVHLGSEECDHCRMVISDLRFAAQALTTRGRAYKFDAVECLAIWVRAGDVPRKELHSLWVSNFAVPGEWVAADEAVFLHAESLRSPMGQGLAAFASSEEAAAHQRELGGQVLTWPEVVDLVDRSRLHPVGHGHRADLGASDAVHGPHPGH